MFNNEQYNLKIILSVTEVTLHIPELDLEPEVDVLLSNPEVVEKLEQCVMNWQTQITIVIEEQLNKKPQVCDSSCIPNFSQSQFGFTTAEEHNLQVKDLG